MIFMFGLRFVIFFIVHTQSLCYLPYLMCISKLLILRKFCILIVTFMSTLHLYLYIIPLAPEKGEHSLLVPYCETCWN